MPIKENKSVCVCVCYEFRILVLFCKTVLYHCIQDSYCTHFAITIMNDTEQMDILCLVKKKYSRGQKELFKYFFPVS